MCDSFCMMCVGVVLHIVNSECYSCYKLGGCPFGPDEVWNITWPATNTSTTAVQKCPGSSEVEGTYIDKCSYRVASYVLFISLFLYLFYNCTHTHGHAHTYARARTHTYICGKRPYLGYVNSEQKPNQIHMLEQQFIQG